MEKRQEDVHEALCHYFPEGGWQLEHNTTGYSHVTIFVNVPAGSFVLRIYQPHGKLYRIKKEHAYLNQLSCVKGLSFTFPKIVPSLKGETLIPLSNGLHATLFERIPGSSPDYLNLDHWKSMGIATAEVLKAFGTIKTESIPEITISEMLYNFYLPLNRENFVKQVKDSVLADEYSEVMDLMVKEADLVEKALASAKLPVQVIHGDLHSNNYLMFDGKVSGVVDFEFTKPAWRVMDVAAALCYTGPDSDSIDYMACVDPFAAGFCEKGELTEEEINVIPLVIKLRYVSLFVATINWHSREKTESSLRANKLILEVGSNVIPWVNESAEKIVQAFTSRMKSRSRE